MSILLIFTLLFFMTGSVNSFKVPGYSGGTVIIYCHYNIEEESNGKYFCKENTIWRCKDKIRSGSQNTWVPSGRFSLYDNTSKNYFMVVIRRLTRHDEGTYWFGVDKPGVPDSYTKVELEVKEDECCTKSVTITNNLGGEATIICNYPENQEYTHVYLCKEDNHSKIYCEIISADSTSAKSGRFSLTDRREKRYTVTISNLTEDDTGTYWCGVENRKSGEHYISLFTKVHLNVIVSTTKPTTTSATSKTITTTSATSKTITTTSPTSNPTSTPTTSTNSSSSVNRPDTPLVIFVCVCVVVLLLLICLFILYRQKHKKTTAISPLHILNTDPGVNREGRHGDSEYEEIKERPLQSDSCDTTTTIYTTVSLPRKPSDSLHYASVNFHKDPSCPNEATTTISKEDTSCCVYATVNVDQNSTYSTVNHPHSTS